MKLVRVAAAAVNQTPLDWDANLRNITTAIETARQREVQVLCLPELCVTGYGCEDAFFSTAVIGQAGELLGELTPMSRGLVVSVGLPVLHGGALFNTSALLVNGQLAGLVAKQHLAGDGLHYEPRWFKPWPANVVDQIEIAGSRCPVGDLLFEFSNARLGFEICEDAWVANRPGLEHAQLACDLILNPSASHFAFAKAGVRRRLVEEASRSLGVTYVYSNLMGNEAGRAIYDGHTLIASNGQLLVSGPRLSYAPVHLIDAVTDIDATRMRRAQLASYRPRIDFDPRRRVSVHYALRTTSPSAATPHGKAADWERSAFSKEEEFTRAIALALFDYLRKSRSRGFVVSLSGGADSAAVACLVATMVRLAVGELGLPEFCRVIGTEPPSGAEAESELTRRLLTTVYQATRNSSDATRDAARTVAESLPADHLELDVDELCQSYTAKVERALGRDLTWEHDDLALQNIQARARGPSAWMIANVRQSLLLATSNRSEAAVGYATMDGDTCGGISPIAGIDKAFLRHWLRFRATVASVARWACRCPIAGIDKAFLRHWLRWLETEGVDGLEPLHALRVVNSLQPTAELRPQTAAQTDESDLMPYELLDVIEDHAIGEKRSPAEVLEFVAAEFPEYSREQLVAWVRRFFELWSRNQWKRERYAPSFHVDDKNLDPKTWCRFPILSGGFRRELSQLC